MQDSTLCPRQYLHACTWVFTTVTWRVAAYTQAYETFESHTELIFIQGLLYV